MKTQLTPSTGHQRTNLRSGLRIVTFVALLALIGIPLFSSSSASSSRRQLGVRAPSTPAALNVSERRLPKPERAQISDQLFTGSFLSSRALSLPPPQAGESIATYEYPGCTVPKISFDLGETVCAIVTGAPLGDDGRAARRIAWVSPYGSVTQGAEITTDPQTGTYVIPGTATQTFEDDGGGTITVDNRGKWRIYLSSAADNSLRIETTFTVHDPAKDFVDLSINQTHTIAQSEVGEGSSGAFEIYVNNTGPSAATDVVITDTIPDNTTFSSAVEEAGGPGFTCGSPTLGVFTCTLASLPVDTTAHITFNYSVNSGTPAGTVLTNLASISSSATPCAPDATCEIQANDNSSSGTALVPTSTGSPTCTLDCPNNITVTADTTQGGNAGAFVTYSAAQPIGDCGAVSNTPVSGSFFTVGTHTVTSNSESGDSCTFLVNVVETALSISCPPNQNVTAATGESTASVNPGTPTTDPSSGVTVTGIRSDDDDDPETPPMSLTAVPYSVGITFIDWTVKDVTGNTDTCQQRITVNAADRDNLTISCPADQAVAAPSGACEATVNPGTPTTNPSDNNVTVAGVRSDGEALNAPYPAGVTVITWSATDAINGQSASCTQTITVTTDSGDTTPPTFTSVPGPVTVTTNSCGQIVGESELGTPEATDTGNNCAPGTVNIARAGVPPGNFFPTGTTTITYTASDAAGNSATATQTVTVTESPAIPPTITAPGDVSVNTGPGATTCSAVVSDAVLGSASASDNCPGVTVVRTGVPAGNIFPIGSTTVTYTVTDRSGNTAIDTQNVTVVDNTVPVLTPPGAITLYTGPGATSCGVTVSDLDGTLGTGSATDNCPGVGAVIRSGVPAGNVFPLGDTTLTYSVTDANGNSAQATQLVTVVDNTVPIVTPPANVTAYTGAGATTCGTVVSDATLGTASATDNCPNVGAVSRTGVPSGNNFPVGTTTVTYSVTDAHGNSASANQTVTVIDDTAPVISCPANIVIEPTCPTGAIATYATPTATDNCGVQSVTRDAGSLASGSVFPIGTTTVTHTATDIHGNTASCSFTVTVLTPQAVIQNLINEVSASSLTGTQKNGLLARLNAALTAINGGGGNACAKLNDFINSVGNLISHGDLTAAQGNAWISSANHVRNTIGCTNLPCS